jgi:cellulose synthase/poly-beta-1,6-N-acetylglucosamine synthase-like glycosyltransferase
MKKFFGGLFILGLVFCVAFYVGKTRRPNSLSVASTPVFVPSPYPLMNHPFVVVIVGYNNGAWLEQTLQSASHQNYPNFRIIYIDDASTDGSFDLAKDLTQENPHKNLIELHQNGEHLGMLSNLVQAIGACEAEEIVVLLGGEDWLAHEWVLSRLNQYYAKPTVWLTYGQSMEYPSYSRGSITTADATLSVRQQPFFASQLHSFYAGLFQKISLPDLEYSAAVQQAYMLPMLEMAESHVAFIPDILHITNKLGTKEDYEMASVCEKAIRRLAAYSPLLKRQSELEEDEL